MDADTSCASSETGADERLWPWESSRRRPSAWLLLRCPLAFLLLFFVYPLQGIVRESFFREGSALSSLKPLVTDPYFGQRAWFTLWQATASTLLTLVVAMPLA